jgi:hypothetical protein
VLRQAGTRFAYLHGSRATGQHRSDSDIDVAAYFGGSAPNSFDILLPYGIDLMVLDDAPLELAGRVAVSGKLLFQDDQVARIRWEAMTRRSTSTNCRGFLAPTTSSPLPLQPGPGSRWLTKPASSASFAPSPTTSPCLEASQPPVRAAARIRARIRQYEPRLDDFMSLPVCVCSVTVRLIGILVSR